MPGHRPLATLAHHVEPATPAAALGDLLPRCDTCDAVCCRLTVVVQPEDRIPAHLTDVTEAGLEVMARDEEGWCVAVDAAHMRCSIYATRPEVCRRFEMSGPYCQAVRADYADRTARGIPLTLY